jgi:predicted MFS family arabinose efflux permease
MEDLERPLRGEIMVDIKRVLDAEANRIKVIRDRRVSDSETFKNVVLSALFALFTFLGQFLYDISGLRAWVEDFNGSD